MPQLGAIKHGYDLGKSGAFPTYASRKYIWAACIGCGKERWVQLKKGCPRSLRCQHCAARSGELSPQWKGGRRSDNGKGYIRILLKSDNFFFPMATKEQTVLEHRLVMAQHLGRNLHLWEIVHHKHTRYPAGSIEDKQDNRIENLQLVTDDRHTQLTRLEARIKQLEQRLTLLEAENILLRDEHPVKK